MEPAVAASEERWRALLAAGEERAAAEWLVGRYAGEVFGLCAAMVRDRAAAEDLTQDAFGRAFASLGGYRGEASSRTWLLAIARNRCIDFLRARRRDPWAGTLGDEAFEPDGQPDDAPLPPDLLSRRAEVEEALAALAEGDRALVVLRFGHGLEYAELAAAFGLKQGAVRMRISRALARMRAALEAPADLDLLASIGGPASAAAPAAPPARRPTAPPAPGAPAPPQPGLREPAPGPPPLGSPAPRGPAGARMPPSFGSAAPARARAAAQAGTGGAATGERTRGGLLRRIFGLGAPDPVSTSASAPATPAQGLAAYLSAVDEGVPPSLTDRLLAAARALRGR